MDNDALDKLAAHPGIQHSSPDLQYSPVTDYQPTLPNNVTHVDNNNFSASKNPLENLQNDTAQAIERVAEDLAKQILPHNEYYNDKRSSDSALITDNQNLLDPTQAVSSLSNGDEQVTTTLKLDMLSIAPLVGYADFFSTGIMQQPSDKQTMEQVSDSREPTLHRSDDNARQKVHFGDTLINPLLNDTNQQTMTPENHPSQTRQK